MDDCIFCKIIKGVIPCYKVYEDDGYIAFFDINSLNPGHTMVIPKKHYRWVYDVPDIGSYYKVVQKIALAQKKAFDTDYIVSIVMGDAVPHAHVHLIPRHEDDGHGGGIKLDNIKKFSDAEMTGFADKIKQQLQVQTPPRLHN